MEKGLRTVLVAMRLAKLSGAPRDQLGTIFWVGALRFVGCTAFAPEEAALAAGDDNSVRKTLVFADLASPRDMIERVVRGFAPEAPLLARAGATARFFPSPDLPARYAKAHCESAVFFARSLGMPEAVARALNVTGERGDGRGLRGLGGSELPLAARIADVADVLELFAWTGTGARPAGARPARRTDARPGAGGRGARRAARAARGTQHPLGLGGVPGCGAHAPASRRRGGGSRLRGPGPIRRSEERLHADP